MKPENLLMTVDGGDPGLQRACSDDVNVAGSVAGVVNVLVRRVAAGAEHPAQAIKIGAFERCRQAELEDAAPAATFPQCFEVQEFTAALSHLERSVSRCMGSTRSMPGAGVEIHQRVDVVVLEIFDFCCHAFQLPPLVGPEMP